MLRAISFCAVSSEEQAKDDKTSLETQARDNRAFAEANNMQIVDVLIVGGFSRRFYNYPEFVAAAASEGFYDPERMLEHWRRRDFDVLLARDGSRLGREQGILGEFVARTVHGGARLYMTNGGWIAEDNYREYIAMNGYSSSKEVDRLISGGKETKLKQASKGLTAGGHPPYSHKWVRNDAGKQLRLEVDETKRRLWDDLATVFLAGTGYYKLESVLYEQYGHVDERTGKPFARLFFYNELHNPYFWGHSGRGYKSKNTRNGQKGGDWVFDASVPVPDGVHIYYDVNEPVYKDALAARIRAEIKRRQMAIRGAADPTHTHKFSGLLICGYCGRYMVYGDRDQGGKYRCQSVAKVLQAPKCDRYRRIREATIETWLNERLIEMIERQNPDLLASGDERPDVGRRIEGLHQEIADLRAQAARLVTDKAKSHSALSSIYDEELQRIGERLEILEGTLSESEREAKLHDTSSARAAFHDLPPDISKFWGQSSTTINQMLHRLVGNRRIVIKDGEITGTADAPPHHARKERRRGYKLNRSKD